MKIIAKKKNAFTIHLFIVYKKKEKNILFHFLYTTKAYK